MNMVKILIKAKCSHVGKSVGPYENLGRNNYDGAGVSELRAYINIGFALERREERETSHIR